jgi:uncharacterized protein (TIGR02466 family)
MLTLQPMFFEAFYAEHMSHIEDHCPIMAKRAWEIGMIPDYDLVNDPIFKLAITKCVEKIAPMAESFNVEVRGVEMTSCRLQFHNPGVVEMEHNHKNAHFTAVYYIDVPEDSGMLIFKSSAAYFDSMPLPIRVFKEQAGYKEWRWVPYNSALIIHRSNIHHYVSKNMSDKSQIAIIMDFIVKGNMNDREFE